MEHSQRLAQRRSPSPSPTAAHRRAVQLPTTEVIIKGDVYIRAPRQWVRGTLIVARDRLHFAGHAQHSTFVIAATIPAVRRCRVLPSTAAGYDVGVFELTLRAGDAAALAVATWPPLGTPAGTLWLKSATTNDAMEWAEAIDDAASAAHDAAQGRDASWFKIPAVPAFMSLRPPSTRHRHSPALVMSASGPRTSMMSSSSSSAGSSSEDDNSRKAPALTLSPASVMVEHYAALAKSESAFPPIKLPVPM
uniref:PH domain-containing protein n=1 Tax=Neobodo designis TaxID=312471 RepID=A0A7S1WAU1_NEODS|mmetsp:Transcript_9396/g.29088  ORF Transcript_9396/g.29088 Transcript_9396/m.29088 type:complete len:249 (+) Transcript_9396:155-901(+)